MRISDIWVVLLMHCIGCDAQLLVQSIVHVSVPVCEMAQLA